ncbi:ornithine carbamoyltransferase [Paenibacillus popilliae ATCC 14706]|uniref:Ornithine carbamoyltransferase n=1 Tax=Paenibacillus popilliae ATCC 14706 TaxID=1212764 RepID=M9LJJ1_PAEPP|nr:ornithine carbamoyltransferase [Paenibacillus popilliae ATCC 14706]
MVSFITLYVYFAVASYTDAWIEMASSIVDITSKNVASYTDAWIEIGRHRSESQKEDVASYTDAWIEIPCTNGNDCPL